MLLPEQAKAFAFGGEVSLEQPGAAGELALSLKPTRQLPSERSVLGAGCEAGGAWKRSGSVGRNTGFPPVFEGPRDLQTRWLVSEPGPRCALTRSLRAVSALAASCAPGRGVRPVHRRLSRGEPTKDLSPQAGESAREGPCLL